MIPFSWKEAKKEAIKHMKHRIAVYEKNGRVDQANKLKNKVKELLDND